MIHKYKLNGFNIVLDVCSGGVHIVDDAAFDILDYTDENMTELPSQDIIDALCDKYGEQTVRAVYSELYALKKDGLLYAKDVYAPFADKMNNATLKSMCLNIAHDCNLRCEYCFASKGDFGTGRKLMPFEVAKAAIDMLVERSKGRRNLEVDFFGGEPLMNFEVVKQTVEYARSLEAEHNKNFRFTITTNGLLLTDDKIDFINREMHNVVLSLDGRKEINDAMRVRVDGSGCYDRIVPQYQTLVKERTGDYYARATFTCKNLDFTKDIEHLYSLGFDQLSAEPVVSDPLLDYSIKQKDLPAVFDEYERLACRLIEMKKQGEHINFFHFMIDLDQGPCAIRRLRGCSCGNEYVAVTPEGNIYPCHQFVGHDKFIMGNVLEGSYNTEIKEYFSKTNVYYKEDCKNCWAKFYCSGGCNANNYQYEGDVLKAHSMYCELEKKRLECAIMIKAALMD